MTSKTITHDQKLQAFALFVIAIDRMNQANVFHQQAAKVLDIDADGHLSDAIFGRKEANPSLQAFEDMLAREEITVLDLEVA